MALSAAYGRVDIPTVGEDEPVFILRARDVLAVAAIQMYRLLAEAHGCRVAEGLNNEIGSFLKWPGHRQLPEWPAAGGEGLRARLEPASRGERPWRSATTAAREQQRAGET